MFTDPFYTITQVALQDVLFFQLLHKEINFQTNANKPLLPGVSQNVI